MVRILSPRVNIEPLREEAFFRVIRGSFTRGDHHPRSVTMSRSLRAIEALCLLGLYKHFDTIDYVQARRQRVKNNFEINIYELNFND